MDTERLSLALELGQQTLAETEDGAVSLPRAEVVTSMTMRLIHQACAEAIPRSRVREGSRPANWWTDEIAMLRRKCLSCRRVAQRAKKSDRNAALGIAEYLVVKISLGRAIKASKYRCWTRLRDELNNDPRGLGYKIVMRKFGAFAKNATMEAESMDRIVDALFPTHQTAKRSEDPWTPEDLEAPPFTLVELRSAV